MATAPVPGSAITKLHQAAGRESYDTLRTFHERGLHISTELPLGFPDMERPLNIFNS